MGDEDRDEDGSANRTLHDAAVAALRASRDRCQDADLNSLQTFSRILTSAGTTRFWSTLMEVSSAPHVETKHNGVTYSTPPYDVDHFRSFMIEYRKLFILDTEHTVVPRLLNRLRAVVVPEDVAWIDELGRRLKVARADRTAPLQLMFGPSREAAQRTPPLDLLFKLANGEWFHSDDRYAAFGDMLRGNERFVIGLVLECVLETMNVAIDLDNALRAAAWVPDLPQPTPR